VRTESSPAARRAVAPVVVASKRASKHASKGNPSATLPTRGAKDAKTPGRPSLAKDVKGAKRAKSAKAPTKKEAAAPAARRSLRGEAAVRPSAPRAAGKARGAGPRGRAKADVPSDDFSVDLITDPSQLLEALNSSPSSTRRPASGERAERSTRGQLLAPTAPSRPGRAEAKSVPAPAPALRPGERVQRTAGGAVVLRRGRK
jgi:hypothetical protein